MRQDIIDLYDDFTHRGLDRRIFMTRLAELAGGTGAALALVPLLEANRAAAAIVAGDDPRITTERVSVPRGGRELRGYLARPAGDASGLGGVVVVHENRGLNAHIEDVTRRVAVAGMIGFAPDFLSVSGGTPENEDTARTMIGELNMEEVVADAKAALSWLSERPSANGEVGMVGFCWGGGVVGAVATAAPELDAGVVFYGRVPPLDAVGRIEAPLLLHYAGLDERINANVPAFKEALEQAGVRYTVHEYDGVNHAFHNDTSAARYDEAAATLAWDRTIAFLRQNLA